MEEVQVRDGKFVLHNGAGRTKRALSTIISLLRDPYLLEVFGFFKRRMNVDQVPVRPLGECYLIDDDCQERT